MAGPMALVVLLGITLRGADESGPVVTGPDTDGDFGICNRTSETCPSQLQDVRLSDANIRETLSVISRVTRVSTEAFAKAWADVPAMTRSVPKVVRDLNASIQAMQHIFLRDTREFRSREGHPYTIHYPQLRSCQRIEDLGPNPSLEASCLSR